MSKAVKSKLDPFAEKLDTWFGVEKITLDAAVERLAGLGCAVSPSRLSVWWAAQEQKQMQRNILGQIATGAQACKDIDKAFARNPAPEFGTIIKLVKVLILKTSAQANAKPEMIKSLVTLIGPALEYSKLQEKKAEREFSEQKYRDQVAEKKANIEREIGKARIAGGLTPETLSKIEAELKLL